MSYENKRIAKLREYLINIIDALIEDKKYHLNANMLNNDPNNYSLDKMPTASTVERWIFGIEIHKDTFTLRGRFRYTGDTETNLENIGFFEDFEQIIEQKNKRKELPDIDGIESIECLNAGTLNSATSNTAEFDIQIQIKYRVNNKKEGVSLWTM